MILVSRIVLAQNASSVNLKRQRSFDSLRSLPCNQAGQFAGLLRQEVQCAPDASEQGIWDWWRAINGHIFEDQRPESREHQS
jgi:hypothetical protein